MEVNREAEELEGRDEEEKEQREVFITSCSWLGLTRHPAWVH